MRLTANPDPDEVALTALRQRIAGRSLRIEDHFDSRAAVYRVAVKLARQADPDLDRLAAAMLAAHKCERPPSLNHVLGIPEDWSGTRKDIRNSWLRKASRALDVPEGRSRRRMLHEAWASFVRELWPSWRDDDEPPPDCAALNYALFYATRAARGNVLSDRQLANIPGLEIDSD